MIHVGTPAARRLHGPCTLADAERRQLRLISYDRPGYGGSTPRPGHGGRVLGVACPYDADGLDWLAGFTQEAREDVRLTLVDRAAARALFHQERGGDAGCQDPANACYRLLGLPASLPLYIDTCIFRY